MHDVISATATCALQDLPALSVPPIGLTFAGTSCLFITSAVGSFGNRALAALAKDYGGIAIRRWTVWPRR